MKTKQPGCHSKRWISSPIFRLFVHYSQISPKSLVRIRPPPSAPCSKVASRGSQHLSRRRSYTATTRFQAERRGKKPQPNTPLNGRRPIASPPRMGPVRVEITAVDGKTYGTRQDNLSAFPHQLHVNTSRASIRSIWLKKAT